MKEKLLKNGETEILNCIIILNSNNNNIIINYSCIEISHYDLTISFFLIKNTQIFEIFVEQIVVYKFESFIFIIFMILMILFSNFITHYYPY